MKKLYILAGIVIGGLTLLVIGTIIFTAIQIN